MKPFKIIVITVFSLLSMQAMAQSKSFGAQLYWMEQFNQAKKVLLHEAANPGNLAAWFYLGKIYTEQGNMDSARYCFNAIKTANAKSTLNTVGEALLLGKSGQKAPALSMLDKAVKPARSDKDFFALTEIAYARYALGDSVMWKVPLETALKIKQDASVYMAYGDIYARMGEIDPNGGYNSKAASQYVQAEYFDEKNPEAPSKLAHLYIRILNYGSAEEIIQQILKEDSTYVPGLKQAGEYYYSVGKYPLACHYFKNYMNAIEPTSKDMARYTTFLFFNKQYDKTGEYANIVLQTDPENAIMLRLKGYSDYEKGKYADGLQAMNKFFSLRAGKDDKKIPSDYEYYGRLQLQNNQAEAGIENLKKAIQLDPQRIYLYEDIARAYDEQKKYMEAVDIYDKYIPLKGTGTSGLYFRKGTDLLYYERSLAGTADSLKSPALLWRADSAFAKVCELSPASHIGFWMRAQVGALLDKDSKLGLAKTHYEKTLSIVEPNPSKYKEVITQACWYLGSYYYTKWDESKAAGITGTTEELKNQSQTYWTKLMAIDPTNPAAITALSELNKK